ncbi:MAG: amidohydrolase family protein [Clostridia bacterium]|nr:amidohydrolase family protein [Clostridia bacterium]
MLTRLKNVDTIVTCDICDHVFRHVDLWFENGEIIKIGSLDRIPDAEYDCSDMIVYPGLINVHHHLYQYFTRNLRKVQDYELFDWLKALYGVWKNLNEKTVLYSSCAGMAELMRYGCTTCFDHHYVFPQKSGDLLAAQFEAANVLGIRMHASRGSMDLSEKDGGLPPDSVVQTVDEILKDSESAIRTYHDPNRFSMRRIVLAPCSPFSASSLLYRESAELARVYGVQLHTHLCETKDEEDYTIASFGKRPFDYIASLGWTGPDVFYAHGIHFNDVELDAIAETETKIAHCPVSNMKLSSGVMRLPDMLDRGITVGLAVDGSASNDGSDLMDEMRGAYLLHRLTWGNRAPSGYQILKLATAGSAKVLGRDDIGSIEPGMAADVFAIKKDSSDLLCAVDNPANLFGNVGYHRPCDLVFVNGKLTVRDGVLVNLDENALLQLSRNELNRFLRSI